MFIEINDLSKHYGRNVYGLKHLSLTIPGGMFGLLGPNGAGKTTLMRVLAGILRPTSGSIRIGEYNGATERGQMEVKRVLGYLPQDFGVYPDLSAREFLDYIGILKGLDDRSKRRRRVNEVLEMVALADVAHRTLHTFSGGMKRRVGIAQALLNDPQLLIVDEPTAGLDPEERIRFRNLLSDLAGNRTVLLSTHIVEDIAQTCQQVAVMKRGQVLFQGTLATMVSATRGKVWLVNSTGGRPPTHGTVVSTMHLGTTIRYRVVSALPPQTEALSTEPSVEDSYVWLMQEAERMAIH